MKLYKFIGLACAALMLNACNNKAVDDLKGIYPPPTDETAVSAVDLGIEKLSKSSRIFSVEFTMESGETLVMQMLGATYFLPTASYTPADYVSAKNGNYIVATDMAPGYGSYFRKSDGTQYNVTNGNLTVTKQGETDDYKVSGALWLSDESVIRVKGTVQLHYEQTEPDEFPELKSAQDNGDGTITFVISTGGYTEELDMTTYQMVYTGEGRELQVTMPSPDGKLYPGIYNPGDYIPGTQIEVDWGFGPMLMDYGTIYYEIKDGAKIPTYINEGVLNVTKEGPVYNVVFEQGKGGINVQYSGPISALDPDGGDVEIVMLTSAMSVSSYAGWGVPILDVVLNNGDIAFDMTTYTMSGSGDMLQIEVYSADGALNPGEYTLAADDASCQEGTFRAGYIGQYGNSGTYACKIENGQQGEPEFITEGTLTISGDAGSPRSFTLNLGKKMYMGTVDLSPFGY